MSDADDRMERAERIREMRQSRERPDEGNEGDAADEADENTGEGVDADDDSTAEVDADGDATDDPDADGDAASDGAGHRATPDATPAATTAADATTTDPGDAGNGQSASVDVAGAIGDSAAGGTGIAPLGGASGFSPSDADGSDGGEREDDGGGTARTRGATRADATPAASAESSVRVLEFVVGDQTYCTDIERVEEIVKREAITRVPNTHGAVEGVVDLRGQITTILDAKQLLDVAERGRESLLVIFSPDAFEEHGTVGWVVDEVRQVVPVADSQVRTAPGDDDHVRGIVDRADADDLTVWIRPGVAMSRAVDGAGLESDPTE